MLLNPHDWSLAQQIDRVLPSLSEELSAHVTPETHRSALELGTGVHADAAGRGRGAAAPAPTLDDELAPLGLRCASAGTHPFTVWHETVISSGDRYEQVYGSMRELARREPTFALHVHVGVRDPEAASGWSTGCGRTCRCCWPCRSTHRSGRAATPAWARRARRCSRRSRGWASRARSRITRTGCSPWTC